MSKRCTTITADEAKAQVRWKNPSIVIQQHDCGVVKHCTITIECPWHLAEIEKACKAIRDNWREQIK